MREDALLRVRFLLVTAGAADGGIEAVFVQCLPQGLGLHDVGVNGAAVGDGRNAFGEAFRVGVDQKVEAEAPGYIIAEADHLAELPRRVDVQGREGQRRRVKSLERQMEKHGRVLADRIEEDRALELRCYLPENMDALGFKPIKMVRVHVVACSNIGQGPLAPFQRQA